MQKEARAPTSEPAFPVEVIVNARSGAGGTDGVCEQLQEVFLRSNLPARISFAHSVSEMIDHARRAAESDCRIVIAGGGDGTISTVVNAIIGKGKVLGVLPLGTLNHFAKDLQIPLEFEEAIHTIVAGQIKRVDVAEVNGRYFINNSSLGLYPSIVRERQKQERLGYSKWPAFVWAAITVLRRYPFLDVKLSAAGQEFISRTPFLFVGNNEYQMERFQIGARDCINAGKLSLYMTHNIGRWGLVRLAFRSLIGKLREDKDFTAMCAAEIWIEARRKRLRVAFDGEVSETAPPLHYRVHPLALQVLVPNDKR